MSAFTAMGAALARAMFGGHPSHFLKSAGARDVSNEPRDARGRWTGGKAITPAIALRDRPAPKLRAGLNLPREGFDGHRGHSLWRPPAGSEAARLCGDREGVEFRRGFPKFAPFVAKIGGVKARVQIQFTGDREKDFRRGDKALAERLNWRTKSGRPDVARVKRYRQRNRLTYHHTEKCADPKLELVPTALHSATVRRRPQPMQLTPKQIRAHVEDELGGFYLGDGKSLTPQQFADRASQLERTLGGAALPDDYETFLRACGLYGVDCHVSHREATFPVSVFFGFDNHAAYNLAWNYGNFFGRVPNGALPFAMDDGGDLFLLDLKSGVVSAWSHETQRTTPLFASFENFFEALEPSDDEEEEDD